MKLCECILNIYMFMLLGIYDNYIFQFSVLFALKMYFDIFISRNQQTKCIFHIKTTIHVRIVDTHTQFNLTILFHFYIVSNKCDRNENKLPLSCSITERRKMKWKKKTRTIHSESETKLCIFFFVVISLLTHICYCCCDCNLVR